MKKVEKEKSNVEELFKDMPQHMLKRLMEKAMEKDYDSGQDEINYLMRFIHDLRPENRQHQLLAIIAGDFIEHAEKAIFIAIEESKERGEYEFYAAQAVKIIVKQMRKIADRVEKSMEQGG